MWSDLFGVLYTTYILKDICLFKLENFSSMISMKVFSVPLTLVFLLLFVLFLDLILSQISRMFYANSFLLDLIFSLTNESFSTISQTPEILFSISYILLMMLASAVPD